jgi:ubiquinone biosynthesis monooxygenase Coq7
MTRRLTALDRIIGEADTVCVPSAAAATLASRPSPAAGHQDVDFDEARRRHVAGLMRVNHTGEVCAQALYQGQALTAKLPDGS